jgi:hydrogenase-4 component F
MLHGDRVRRAVLLSAAIVHAGMAGATWWTLPAPLLNGWLQLDALGRVFLSITSALFLAAAVYSLGYLRQEHEATRRTDIEEGFLFANAPEATFTGCLLLFLAAMTLVTCSHRFGLLWVAIEAITFERAPDLFSSHHRSLGATWKYLMICSVGILWHCSAIFFAVAASNPGGVHSPWLGIGAERLSIPTWLKAAFLLTCGHGTKMGLAPLRPVARRPQ